MSVSFGNREPNGLGGCLAILMVLAALAAAGGAFWQFADFIARALVA